MAPTVVLRIVTSYDDVRRRVDVEITGSRAVLHEDGRATPFETERLWPVVRELMPPLDQLRADPPRHRSPAPAVAPGEDWANRCRALVVIAVAPRGLENESPEPVLRTWFATDDEIWAATPDVRRAR